MTTLYIFGFVYLVVFSSFFSFIPCDKGAVNKLGLPKVFGEPAPQEAMRINHGIVTARSPNDVLRLVDMLFHRTIRANMLPEQEAAVLKVIKEDVGALPTVVQIA